LNDVDGLSNDERCNWNSWDRSCEVSMTVFNRAPFDLPVDSVIRARTMASKDYSALPESTSEYIYNGQSASATSAGLTCADEPILKPLPE